MADVSEYPDTLRAACKRVHGLVFSIVRDIVEAHGGGVEVASDGLGTGCTCALVLPVVLPFDDDPEQPSALALGVPPGRSGLGSLCGTRGSA